MAAPEMQFIAREVESLFRAHYNKLVWYAQTLLTRNAQTSDPGRAEEVSRRRLPLPGPNGRTCSPAPIPPGWLYNTVNNVVRNMIRADQRGPPACSRPRPRCPTSPSSPRRGPTWNWKVWSPKKSWSC